MPDTISPVTREEDYLAAIAGQDVTPPTPVTRKEEWLDLIAGNVDDLAGDIKDLQDVVPTPAAGDSGKVLTAGADGTGSWADAPKELPASLGTAGQVLTVNAGATGVEWATPSGGGGVLVMKCTGTGEETADGILVPLDTSIADLMAATSSFTPVFVAIPAYTDTSPYYNYQSGPTAIPLWSPFVPNTTFYEDSVGYVYSLSIGGTGLALLRSVGSN